MLNKNACGCACYDDPICVAYVFYSNNECYFYQTVTETDADSNAEAYIKKNEGKWYLLFNIVLLKIKNIMLPKFKMCYKIFVNSQIRFEPSLDRIW